MYSILARNEEKANVRLNMADGESEEMQSEHPSQKQEDVSLRTNRGGTGTHTLGFSQKVANIFLFAMIEVWLFAIQFIPEAFLFDTEEYQDMAIFQEVTMGFFLLAFVFVLLCRKWSIKRWGFIGDASVVVSLVCVLIYIVLIRADVLTPGLYRAFALVNHMLLGFSVGMVFCNWVRLYVWYEENIALMIGLSLVIAGIGSAIIAVLPRTVDNVVVTFIPVVVIALEWVLRKQIQKYPDLSVDCVMEGSAPISSNKHFWIGAASIGFICGVMGGFVMTDLPGTQSIAFVCSLVLALVGGGISVYYVATGTNTGYSLPPAVLMCVVCCGFALFAVFQGEYVSYSFGAVYIGQMLFESMILMQLPRVYRKIGSLNTFFAMFLVFRGTILLGVLLRHFLFAGLIDPSQDVVSEIITAVLLCGGIIAVSYMSSDNAVSTAWDLFPISEERAPRKKYASACNAIKEEYGLTAREEEIMRMVGRGRNGTYVQERLVISKSTYQTHMRNLYKKMDIHSDQELIDIIEDELSRLAN